MPTLQDIIARREEILRLAAEHGAHNVRVFGSVVRGESGDDSDVDVLVELDEDCSLLDRIALKQDLEDLLGASVDVVSEGSLHGLLRDRILAEAVAL